MKKFVLQAFQQKVGVFILQSFSFIIFVPARHPKLCSKVSSAPATHNYTVVHSVTSVDDTKEMYNFSIRPFDMEVNQFRCYSIIQHNMKINSNI